MTTAMIRRAASIKLSNYRKSICWLNDILPPTHWFLLICKKSGTNGQHMQAYVQKKMWKSQSYCSGTQQIKSSIWNKTGKVRQSEESFFTVYVNIWFHLYMCWEKRAGKKFVLNNSQMHPWNNQPVYQLLLDFPCFYKTTNICHNLFGCCSNPASISSTAFMQYSEMSEEKMFSCWCRVDFCVSFSYYLELSEKNL